MPTIYVSFTNKYGESKKWTIQDVQIDPSAPATVFDGFLDKDQSTDTIALFANAEGAHAKYTRSDGQWNNVEPRDGDNVEMNF